KINTTRTSLQPRLTHMIGAAQSCGRININEIPIVGTRHLFTAGLKIRRANTLNRCAPTLVALCVERVFASIRKSFFSIRFSLFILEPSPSTMAALAHEDRGEDSCAGHRWSTGLFECPGSKAVLQRRADRSGLTDDFSAQPCRIAGGTDDETDRAPACHDRKPFSRAKSFSRAKPHVAMYARL